MPENSTVVPIQNYSSSELRRTKLENHHGRWYMEQYSDKTWGEPAVNISAKTGKTEMAMEGSLYNGTEGTVEYTFDDNQTVIHIHLNNPLIGSNSYDFDIWGPKKDSYRAEWEGDGSGTYARRTIKIFDK